MIRKIILVVSTMVAIVLLLVAWFCQNSTIEREIWKSSHLRIMSSANAESIAIWWDCGDVQAIEDSGKTARVCMSGPPSPGLSGFAIEQGTIRFHGPFKHIFKGATVPLVVPFMLFAAYPITIIIRGPYCRWRRKRKGLCVKYGYDLRKSPDRCPECGTEVKT